MASRKGILHHRDLLVLTRKMAHPHTVKVRVGVLIFILIGGYSYDNRYLLDANLRSDGTSVFGVNKRFSTTWAIGLAWNVHNEKFMKESLPFIDD